MPKRGRDVRVPQVQVFEIARFILGLIDAKFILPARRTEKLRCQIQLPSGETLDPLDYSWSFLEMEGDVSVITVRMMGDGLGDDGVELTLRFNINADLVGFELDGFYVEGIPEHMNPDSADWPRITMLLIDALYCELCLHRTGPPIQLDSEWKNMHRAVTVVGEGLAQANDSTLGLLRGMGYYTKFGYELATAEQRPAAETHMQKMKRWTPANKQQRRSHNHDLQQLRAGSYEELAQPRLAIAAMRHRMMTNRMSKQMPPEFPLAVDPDLCTFDDIQDYWNRVIVVGRYPEQRTRTIHTRIPSHLVPAVQQLDYIDKDLRRLKPIEPYIADPDDLDWDGEL
jgi:hypothetical protein